MKLLPLSSKNSHHHYTVPDTASMWPWPYCHQPRTLSFRDADLFKTINSAFVLDSAVDTSEPSFPIAASSSEESPSFSTAPSELPDERANDEDDDAAVESLIRGARSERRLFFEPSRGDTSSILADQRSRPNAKANEDASEANEEDDDVAFKKENVTLLAMESRDPYEDFRKSMEEMMEAHGVKGDDWERLEELLCLYLRVNDRDNHGYIYGAFVDLVVDGDRRRRHQCRLPGHQSPSSPLSLYNTSSSSLSSSSSSSLSARCVSVSEAEETVSESTPCSSSSGVSLEVVESSSSSSGA